METYLDVMATLIVVFGVLAAIANVLLSSRRTGYRKWLRILDAGVIVYILAWYIADLFAGLHPGPLMLVAIRPGIAFLMVLFLSNAIANWNARF